MLALLPAGGDDQARGDVAQAVVVLAQVQRHPDSAASTVNTTPATVMRLLRDHEESMGADAGPESDSGAAELAAVMDRLPADTRPAPPTVERYDDLLPSRRRVRESPQQPTPEREEQAAQELSVRRLVRQVIDPGELFEVPDLLERLAGLGIAMTPDKVAGILDYWAVRSQLIPISPGVYRRPAEPDDAA